MSGGLHGWNTAANGPNPAGATTSSNGNIDDEILEDDDDSVDLEEIADVPADEEES